MSTQRRLLPLALTAILAGALTGLLIACGDSATSPEELSTREVSLQLNWFHEAEFVGYYVADAKGFYADNGLSVDIREGGPGDPAIDHVLDDTADVALSSFAEQKAAIAEERPLVAVMATFQIPPLVIFSLAESGITEPADLMGRRVGVTTDYWRGVLDETLKAAGVDASRVAPVEVEAGSLEPLFDGDVEAWLGYAQDEPIQAEVAGREVTTIFPSDYGVGGYEGLVLVNQRTIGDDPDLVRGFVEASQQGWRYAVEHPDEAARILLEWAPEQSLEFQQLAVHAVAPLVDTPQAPIGWIDATRWKQLMGADYDAERPGYTTSYSATDR
jgi:ABC-type nitrate/sulfonate/bicarbonate transport system substrate-binding protein